MNFHATMREYKQTDIASKVEGASKHEFVKIVLDELHKNLNILSYCIKNETKTSPRKSASFAQIVTALTILMTSLDFDKGEPVASNLYNLYNYCKKEVLNGYKDLKTEGIDSAAGIIEDIIDAWKKIN